MTQKMERQRSLSVASDVSGKGRGGSISGVPGPAHTGTLQFLCVRQRARGDEEAATFDSKAGVK
jgi:hypothetical protein